MKCRTFFSKVVVHDKRRKSTYFDHLENGRMCILDSVNSKINSYHSYFLKDKNPLFRLYLGKIAIELLK